MDGSLNLMGAADAPFYLPQSDECEVFAAADNDLPVLLKGGETVWVDGPLTRAVREGAICYLDEVVEARKDVTVVLHPLSDDRRILPIDRTGEELKAPPGFMLVASYNPGYQNILKTLKPSTRQRFVALEFDFPGPEHEIPVVVRESGLAEEKVHLLVRLANKLRDLRGQDLEEGVSTRLVIYAATLIAKRRPRKCVAPFCNGWENANLWRCRKTNVFRTVFMMKTGAYGLRGRMARRCRMPAARVFSAKMKTTG